MNMRKLRESSCRNIYRHGLILQSHQDITIIISHVVYSRLSGNADSVEMFSSVQPRIGSGLVERELIE